MYKNKKYRLIIFSLSIVVSVIICEAIIRITNFAPDVISLNLNHIKSGYRSSPNPILGYELKPGYQDDSPSLENGNFPIINSHGQRDIERTFKKPLSRKRVILLGDSIVAGHGVYDLNNTISRQLEIILQQKHDIEVLNLGVGGYQTLAEVELLKVKGLKYSPDIVVLIYEDGDFYPINDDLMFYDPDINPVIMYLIKHSHLFRTLAISFDFMGLRFKLDPGFRRDYHASVLNDSVIKGIEELKMLVREHDISLLIVNWPRFPDDKKVYGSMQDFHVEHGTNENIKKLEKICIEYEIPLYNISEYFMENYNKTFLQKKGMLEGPNRFYTIGDTCHPNEYGSKVAAEYIGKILSDNFIE